VVLVALTGGVTVPDAFAEAAGETDTVNISVVDEKNQPVPGTVIEVRLGETPVTTVTTDASGKTNFTVNNTGAYSLNIRKKGYLPVQTTLEISKGTPVPEVDVVLTSAVLSQQNIEVKGEATSPVANASSGPSTLTPAKANESALRPATLAEALPLVPGIVRGPDGSVRIAGLGEDHSALLVNSVDVSDPATGNFGLSVPIDSVRTIEVSETPYLAEYGRFTAGVVAAETRRGGDKWSYNLNDPFPDFFIRSAHLMGVRDASPRFNLSGPILSNRLYFLEGVEYLLNKQEVITLPFAQSLSTSKAVNSFTQFDAMISPSQTLTGSFHFAPHSLTYSGLDYFNPQPVTPNLDFHETTAALTDRLSVSGGLLQSTIANRVVSSDTSPQGTADMVLTPMGNSGNYFGQESRRADRVEWIEQWAPRTFHFGGDHILQFGSVLAHSENVGDFYAHPVLIQAASGGPLERIDFGGAGAFDVADTDPAVFAQDHWVLSSHLALDVGLRLEAQTITYTTRAAPRTGFVWVPDQGKTIIRGGIGVFYDSVPLDMYAFNGYPQQSITTYNSLGLPIGPPIQYLNLTAQEAQSSFPFVDRSRKSGNFAPYSVAWNIGIERPLSPFLLVGLKYLQNHEQGMLTLQPEIVQNQNAFVLGGSGSAQTRQVEFTARIGAASNRQFFFSYVRQYARGDINAASSYLGNTPFPIVRSNFIGSLASEIPNRFLLWGSYALPHKIRIMPHIEFRNGFPYQPTNAFEQYVAEVNTPQNRFPRYFSLNMRVSKDIQVDSRHAVRLSGTVTNLTNHFNPLEVHSNIADPQYGAFFGNYVRRFVLDFDVLF
jgi:TonB dependent receptor/Carboxypeptidase regulatory-like domain